MGILTQANHRESGIQGYFPISLFPLCSCDRTPPSSHSFSTHFRLMCATKDRITTKSLRVAPSLLGNGREEGRSRIQLELRRSTRIQTSNPLIAFSVSFPAMSWLYFLFVLSPPTRDALRALRTLREEGDPSKSTQAHIYESSVFQRGWRGGFQRVLDLAMNSTSRSTLRSERPTHASAQTRSGTQCLPM